MFQTLACNAYPPCSPQPGHSRSCIVTFNFTVAVSIFTFAAEQGPQLTFSLLFYCRELVSTHFHLSTVTCLKHPSVPSLLTNSPAGSGLKNPRSPRQILCFLIYELTREISDWLKRQVSQRTEMLSILRPDLFATVSLKN